MNEKNFLFVCLFIMNLASCNEGNKDTSVITSVQNDSITKQKNSTQDELPPSVQDQPRTELNDYSSSLHPDSIKIAYRNKVDQIPGYRKGDTLIVEGDILMKLPPKGTRGVATTIGLWPKRSDESVVIHYTVNPNYNFPDAVRSAVSKWSGKTGISFIELNSANIQGDFIEFVPSNNTQSFIGHIGGRQIIELADWAREGNIMHEIGHSLGLYHEQSRADRDTKVQILCPTNINYRHAFQEDPYANDVGQYNFYSIMHYPLVSGCLELQSGIREQLHLPNSIPGQRDSITTSDYLTVKTIYKLK